MRRCRRCNGHCAACDKVRSRGVWHDVNNNATESILSTRLEPKWFRAMRITVLFHGFCSFRFMNHLGFCFGSIIFGKYMRRHGPWINVRLIIKNLNWIPTYAAPLICCHHDNTSFIFENGIFNLCRPFWILDANQGHRKINRPKPKGAPKWSTETKLSLKRRFSAKRASQQVGRGGVV